MRKEIPMKNYIFLGLMFIVTLLIVFCVNMWINAYKDGDLSTSPLKNIINEVNENELSLSISEANQIILYVGYNGDKGVKSFEKKLLKEVRNKGLIDYILYYDVTNSKTTNKYFIKLKEKFPEVSNSIGNAPMLIYIKNGNAVEVINSNNELITINDFKDLIEKYEIGE